MRVASLLLCVLLLPATAPALATEPPLELDTVDVDAARERELLYRLLLEALQARRSDSAEDKDALVCQTGVRPGSLTIKQRRCAANQTWLAERQEQLRTNAEFLGGSTPGADALAYAAASAPYAVRRGTSWALSTQEFQRLSRTHGTEHDPDRLAALLAAHQADRAGDEWRTASDAVDRFARALHAVSALPADAADATLEHAISTQGLSVESYNQLVERLETSARFRARVQAARLLATTEAR